MASGAAGEILGELPGAEAQLQPMAIGVQGHGVAGGDDLGRQRRAPPDLLTDQEERRPGPLGGEDLEHRRRALRVGPIVKGERDSRLTRADAGQATCVGHRRHDGGQGRAQVIDHRPGSCQPDGPAGAALGSPDRAPDWTAGSRLRRSASRTGGRSHASAAQLWRAAQSLRLRDTQMLGRLVRWRIPGLSADIAFDEMFRRAPFIVLDEGEHYLLSGIVGRIWTLRRDYPALSGPDAFREYSARGTVRVLFASWAQDEAGSPGQPGAPCAPRCASRHSEPRAGSVWPPCARSCAAFSN